MAGELVVPQDANPLQIACAHGVLDVVKIISGTFDLEEATRPGLTALALAAHCLQVAVVEYLLSLETKPNVNVLDEFGISLLANMAVMNQSDERVIRIMQLLIENGADLFFKLPILIKESSEKKPRPRILIEFLAVNSPKDVLQVVDRAFH